MMQSQSALVALMLCLAGCSGDSGAPAQEAIDASAPIEQSAEPVYGGHLRVGYVLEPTSLDAVLGRSGGDAYYWRQIYDQLVDVNHSLEPHLSRSLATSWEISEDPDSITFHLRKGIVFHDGTPFNAEAVRFNVERILDPKTMATPRASMTVIESVDALDEHTVRFNLLRPWGAGINMLADRGGVMNSPSEVLALGADYGWKPSGTGPFRVSKVITGTMVNLVRNEDYWAKDEAGRPLPYLDEVTIRVIRDETVLASALRTGEIDVAYLPYKDVAAFRRDPRFSIETMDGSGVALLLAFNVGHEVVQDVNLRLAISHAIDPHVINRAIYFDKVMVADSGMWPVGAWAHDPEVPRPTYDPDKARQYLALGGRPRRFRADHRGQQHPRQHPRRRSDPRHAEEDRRDAEHRGDGGGSRRRELLQRRPLSPLPHRLEPLPRTRLDRFAGLQERRLLQRRQPAAPGCGRAGGAGRLVLQPA